MNIFTDRFKNQSVKPDTDWTKDFLYSIATTGTGISNVKLIIADDAAEITERSSGILRIKRSLENKFRLTKDKPDVISHMDDIKCCLCHRPIPFSQEQSWYYSIRYTTKHFYYFVCFQAPETKPSTKCYRRE